MKKIYLFNTANKLSHPAACLVQGIATSKEYEVCLNVSTEYIDSRGISNPILSSKNIKVKHHDNDEDILIIDEVCPLVRQMGSSEKMQFYENLQRISEYKRVIVLYMQDDANIVKFPDSLELYIAHINKFSNINKQAKPLPFGISQDLIQSYDKFGGVEKKIENVIRNFRPSFSQSVRDSLDLSFVPTLSKSFHVDNRLLDANDYGCQLKNSAAILTYGGAYYRSPRSNPGLIKMLEESLGEKCNTEYPEPENDVVVFRWDSWRLWEAFAMGCAPINLDFELYGLELPEIPKPWDTYIPIDLAHPSATVDKMSELLKWNPAELLNIGSRAREWALEFYSPTALAKRILQ